MTYSIKVLPECIHEIVDICDWYDHKRPKLGDEFELSLDTTITSILKTPKGYSILKRNIHKVKIARFPYNVFNVIESDVILIIGVLHHSRSKKQLRKIIKRDL